QLHKIEFIARTCDSRCSVYASTCKGSNIAGCYRASACECECKAQLDPGNPALGSWQQCSKKFTSLAKVLESREKH
ncbi:MAG TPA: hypothetical protein VMV70_07420, partial [Gallionella sp.]|nr:hypothetical protein [Gallionella sp.]